MIKVVILGSGSQSIQLLRECFSIGITPSNIKVLTVDGDFNLSYIEFLKFYNIEYTICNKKLINEILYRIITEFTPNIVISFSNSFILPKHILLLNTQFINFHPGILPSYKGCFSTVHSIINNEQYVGGTWHYIDHNIDSGNIIKIIKVPVMKLNAFTLNHKIFSLGIACLDEVVNKVLSGFSGEIQESIGTYYSNKFPDISSLDDWTKQRVSYFPPKFI